MTPKARISHELPGRVRLKIPERRGDARYFASLKAQISALSGVERVQVSALAASILIEHDRSTLEGIMDVLRDKELFEVLSDASSAVPAVDSAHAGMLALDDALSRISRGTADLRTLVLLVLLGLAVRQLLRGQILAPAVSLLWYAYELVRWARD
jgi:hypothetical protein